MEVFGNVDALKKAIENRYSLRVKEAEKEKEKRLDEVDKELKKRLEILTMHMKMVSDTETKKAYSRVLSEERMNAKKEFEQKRELMIDAVFKEAEKRAKRFAHSEEYVEFVKKNMPQNRRITVVGDSEYYKKSLPDIEVDNKIVGLKFECDRIIYDFTLDSLIASKRDLLMYEVGKVLFKKDDK